MTKKFFALIAVCLLATQAQAQEQVTVNYNYEGSPNLSDIESSLRFADFSDARDGDPRLITGEKLGDQGAEGGYVAEEALADIVRDAFVAAFESGGVEMAGDDAEMVVAGEILRVDGAITDRNGVESIQLTIRTQISLQEGGRSIYETTLFGRGTVPVEEGIVAAVHAALDRMVRELTRDDYFMIELQ